jgi:hypothetical protein
VSEEKYSWRVLESEVSPNLRSIYSSMKGRKIPNLLVFKPTFKPDSIKKLEPLIINSDDEELYDDPDFDPHYVYTEDEDDQAV